MNAKINIPMLLIGLAAFVTFLAPVVSRRKRSSEDPETRQRKHEGKANTKPGGFTLSDGQSKVVVATFLAFLFLLFMYPW